MFTLEPLAKNPTEREIANMCYEKQFSPLSPLSSALTKV
jgi:hypothetical protein